MSDIPILPNPFKMLDLEREKKMKLTDDKCNSCDDTKKEGFNNLKKDKPIVEGMEQGEWSGLVVMVVMLASSLLIVFIRALVRDKWIKETIKLLMFFVFNVAFAYIALFLHTRDGDIDADIWIKEKKYWIPILVGLIMFLGRFVPGTDDVPALIRYFENTVGHFMFLIFNSGAGLNKWIRSDNFETLINNGDGKVTNDFNPLMSIFNLNNYEDIINNQMRFENVATNPTENTSNTSDFFVTLEHENGIKTKEDFINYIRKKVIMKRAYGEVTLLIITTLISTGILQSVYH